MVDVEHESESSALEKSFRARNFNSLRFFFRYLKRSDAPDDERGGRGEGFGGEGGGEGATGHAEVLVEGGMSTHFAL